MTNLIHLLASIFFLLTLTNLTLSSNNVLYSTLLSSKRLSQGNSLIYKEYALTLQDDCNLVLSGPNHTILWQTSTYEYGDYRCFLQLKLNGELRLLRFRPWQTSYFGYMMWSSGVAYEEREEGEYALVLGYDGSLKIYGPSIWSSHNKLKQNYVLSEPSKVSRVIPVTDSTLWSGDIAPIGTIIVNEDYKLELGMTCNLTLTDTKSGHVLWHTNTSDLTSSCFVNLDRNGEFKVKYLGGATLWTNNASSYWGQEVLALKPDGILAVYGPVLWSSDQKSFGGGANIAMVTA